MEGAFAYIVAIVFFVIALNFFFLYMRLKKDRYRKTGKVAIEEEKAAKLREKEIQRRLNREQEDAARFIELRNKTLDLYDQVRKRANEREKALETGAVSQNSKENDTGH